ncbi:MAG TPA: hypothetical protein VH374_07135 [Polyangia bacterium]|nr:hypothetical protein [Polyangia bacterium]
MQRMNMVRGGGLLVTLAFVACSSSSPSVNGTGGATGSGGGTGGTGTGGSEMDGGSSDGGVTLKAFTKPADPGNGGIIFAASGEVLALSGYAFPPANAGDPAFVDGWDVQFTRLLVTVDKIKLSTNPDYNPDQSMLMANALVAEVDGPWAVDLAHGDNSYLPGKGGQGEEAVPIAALVKQNQPAGNSAPFLTDGTRYAFGFDTVAATAAAMNVNLDADGLVDYGEMIQDQCAVMYVGVATFKGGVVTATTGNMADYTKCNSDPEYANWPKTVNFRLCFKSPTSYVNCQNPDNDPAKPLAGEEHERGIAFDATKSIIGQVTIHTDHPFWDSVLHDSPAHFDQFAARVVPPSTDGGVAADGGATSTPTVTLDMTMGVDYRSYTDAQGNPLKWRYCMDPPTDSHAQFTGAMAFDPQSVAHATGTDRTTGLLDYYDFATYNQSTQGHLNSDGLCALQRHYYQMTLP